jgi:ComEC/Rec2-related protein
VEDVGSYTDGGYYDIKIKESGAGLWSGTGVRLYYAGSVTDEKTGREISVRRGDVLTCDINYKMHTNNALFAKSIDLTAQGSIKSVTQGDGFFYNLRKDTEELTGRLFADYPDEVGGVAKTLIIGETADMDSYVYGLFRNAGLSHLLVISGLHITIIVMSLYSLLEFLTVRRQVRSIVCILVLIAYSAFVVFSPSVSRATIMTGVMLLLSLFLRRTDSITSLFFALLLLLIINPYNLASISLELSFLSCLGILILSPYLMRPVSGGRVKLKKVGLSLLSPLIYSVAAAVFTFPVSLVFDTVSYITPITNLFITPLYTCLLILLIPCLLLFALLGSGAAVFAFVPGGIMEYSILLLKKLYQAA